MKHTISKRGIVFRLGGGVILSLIAVGLFLGTSSKVLPQFIPSCDIATPVVDTPAKKITGQLEILLPGHPFDVATSPDGQWLFVSLVKAGAASEHGLAVLHNDGQDIRLKHIIPLPYAPLGLTIGKKGDEMLVAGGDGVTVIDVASATSEGQDSIKGYVHHGDGAGTIQVLFSADERYAFATDEYQETVSVIDMRRIRAGDYDHGLISQIPVDILPVGMALSPDGRHLYVTSQLSGPGDNALARFSINAADYMGLVQQTGTVTVIDTRHVENDPAKGIVARVPVGCQPVRVTLSPAGDTAWVTARQGNLLLALNTSRLLAGDTKETWSSVAVGPAPVGVTLIDGGKVAVVANSNRFSSEPFAQTLSLIDTNAVLNGQPAELDAVQVGTFPRELALSPDGKTLYLTNYGSNSLTILDVERLLADLLKR